MAIENDEKTTLLVGKIPVRNTWLLFLYAYDLANFQGRFDAEIEDSPDVKSLIARLLCHVLEKRLRYSLSYGIRRRESILKRVRGRIDILRTYSLELLHRGEIACRFEEFTYNTPRNRLIRSALQELGRQLDDCELAFRSNTLANSLSRAGVTGAKPSREEMASVQIGRHETEDRLMISLACAVFDPVLPTEKQGSRPLLRADRDERAFRKLFERAIGNFFAAELPKKEEGWDVYQRKQLKWPTVNTSTKIDKFLPIMETDIILENEQQKRRIVIDTKFTNILTKSRHGDTHRFKSKHIYQLYSYLRSQEYRYDPLSYSSEGMLLYPAIDLNLNERAEIQGHFLRFCTVDLAAQTNEVIERLLELTDPIDKKPDKPHNSVG